MKTLVFQAVAAYGAIFLVVAALTEELDVRENIIEKKPMKRGISGLGYANFAAPSPPFGFASSGPWANTFASFPSSPNVLEDPVLAQQHFHSTSAALAAKTAYFAAKPSSHTLTYPSVLAANAADVAAAHSAAKEATAAAIAARQRVAAAKENVVAQQRIAAAKEAAAAAAIQRSEAAAAAAAAIQRSEAAAAAEAAIQRAAASTAAAQAAAANAAAAAAHAPHSHYAKKEYAPWG